MNRFVSMMQWFHAFLALPAVLWVKGNGWCGLQWEKLRRRDDVPRSGP